METSLINPRGGFQGIWPALLTPLAADRSIDHRRMADLAGSLIEAGCSGITPFGTTGEGPSFSVAERCEAVDQLIASGIPAERLLVSTISAALPDTLSLTRHALERGVHGVMMLPPFFFKGVTDAGIVDAYSQLIEAVGGKDWRLYLYHIPQVAGICLTHPAIKELLGRHRAIIRGIKDSGCDRTFSESLAHAFMPDITIYVGNEPDLRSLARLGSTGAISGLANLAPRGVRALAMAADAPDTDAAETRTLQLLKILQGFSLLPAFKAAMALQHRDESWLRVRPTLTALGEGERQSLGRQLIDAGFAEPES